MTILISIAAIVGMLNLMCLFSRHVARIVGSALLAHADGIDAYRNRASRRAEHWFEKATERESPVIVSIERRMINDNLS